MTHAEVQEVAWERGINGNYEMKPVTGTREKIEADLILLVMGFVHPVIEGLVTELKLSMKSRKNIDIDHTERLRPELERIRSIFKDKP